MDQDDPEEQRFAVGATAEEHRLVEVTSVMKAVWFDEATESGLCLTLFAVPVHFDYQLATEKQTDPLVQATSMCCKRCQGCDQARKRTDSVVQVTAKLPQGKT